ncbi:hypothetical protein RRG08_057145 [Elysia crispata]|uniref:Uncharacterized protein n=1 Tax=Elysia crispata TaxID=231223 RepID=A0AAE1E4F8_9GAST|nr:hypothetical protein RRG08_057145 [Elysia crispata]
MPPPTATLAELSQQHQQQQHHRVQDYRPLDHPGLPTSSGISTPLISNLDQNENYCGSWRGPEQKVAPGEVRDPYPFSHLPQLEGESGQVSEPEGRLEALTKQLQLEQETVSDTVRQLQRNARASPNYTTTSKTHILCQFGS